LNDQQWRRARGFIAWGVFGLIILVAASIIASLLFFGPRASGNYHTFFPGFFFPFHFGWLGGIFVILVFLLIARWIFLRWRNGNTSSTHSQHNGDNSAHNILKERYAMGRNYKGAV
jgi:putative membrane protein